jgi:hypothetical protein
MRVASVDDQIVRLDRAGRGGQVATGHGHRRHGTQVSSAMEVPRETTPRTACPGRTVQR